MSFREIIITFGCIWAVKSGTWESEKVPGGDQPKIPYRRAPRSAHAQPRRAARSAAFRNVFGGLPDALISGLNL